MNKVGLIVKSEFGTSFHVLTFFPQAIDFAEDSQVGKRTTHLLPMHLDVMLGIPGKQRHIRCDKAPGGVINEKQDYFPATALLVLSAGTVCR